LELRKEILEIVHYFFYVYLLQYNEIHQVPLRKS